MSTRSTRFWGDPRVIWWAAAGDREASAERLRVAIDDARDAPGLGWWAIVEKATGEVLGNVGLQRAQHPPNDVELAYHLRYDAWGRGIATEAARHAIDYALKVLRVPRVIAAIVPENRRSQRVAERLGLRKIGTVTHAGLLHDLFAVESEIELPT